MTEAANGGRPNMANKADAVDTVSTPHAAEVLGNPPLAF
jgi:hypothetical protein